MAQTEPAQADGHARQDGEDPELQDALVVFPEGADRKSFTAAGVRSINAPPTTATGPAADRLRPATSSATASAVTAATSPARAPSPAREEVLRKLLTPRLRQPLLSGLLRHPDE